MAAPFRQERSAALHQFRVLGQRTPDFIVGALSSVSFGLEVLTRTE